ncbi:TPA: hypothetical protein N0F65_005385, partial [Lagenidium giganteum]
KVNRTVQHRSQSPQPRDGNKLHPVFNTSSLKPYVEPQRLSKPKEVSCRWFRWTPRTTSHAFASSKPNFFWTRWGIGSARGS